MAEDDPPGETAAGANRPSAQPRHTRRLSDKVLIAFHQACDQGDTEVAQELVRVLELMLSRRPTHADSNRRKNIEGLVAAHERLWLLRNPGRIG